MFRRPSVKKFGDKIRNCHQHLYGRNVCQWCASYVSAVDRYSKCTSNILSKLFEKHTCDHLYDFLEENALLHHLQSGFCKFHSTEIAHIRLIDQLLLDLDKNRATEQVFIDYKKAFDSIDHDLLLTKLNVSEICGHELNFPRNNLSERKQYVVIDGCRSPPWTVTAGVPQGSILGSIMFLLFINDVPVATQRSTVYIYDDDTTFSFPSDVTDGLLGITSALRQDLDDLSQWSAANKMVTNAAKKKCLLVTRKRITNKIADSSLNLHLGNSNIEQVDSQKLLGLTIDRQLGFNIYVEGLCKKLSNE